MKFSLLIFFGLMLFGQTVNSQDNQIVGGKYTFEAMDKKIEGKVFVVFVMAPNGKIIDDSVKSKTSLYGLETIAEKTVKNSPDYKYTQGARRSTKNQKFVVPIDFTLDQLNDKDWSEYFKIKGEKAWSSKLFDEAIKSLTESVRLNKRNSESYYLLGQIFREQGDDKNSTKNFDLAKKYGHKE